MYRFPRFSTPPSGTSQIQTSRSCRLRTTSRTVTRSSTRGTERHEQTLFYEVIAPGKGRCNAMFWCGSATLVRRGALEDVGGVLTDTVAEDFHTTIAMHAQGWRTYYHNEVLVQGLAPHDLAAFLLQRARWARGNLAVFRTKENPVTCDGLTGAQRVSYLASLFNYFSGAQRLLLLVVLTWTLATGVLPMHASLVSLVALWLPWSVLAFVTTGALGRGALGSVRLDSVRHPDDRREPARYRRDVLAACRSVQGHTEGRGRRGWSPSAADARAGERPDDDPRRGLDPASLRVGRGGLAARDAGIRSGRHRGAGCVGTRVHRSDGRATRPTASSAASLPISGSAPRAGCVGSHRGEVGRPHDAGRRCPCSVRGRARIDHEAPDSGAGRRWQPPQSRHGRRGALCVARRPKVSTGSAERSTCATPPAISAHRVLLCGAAATASRELCRTQRRSQRRFDLRAASGFDTQSPSRPPAATRRRLDRWLPSRAA